MGFLDSVKNSATKAKLKGEIALLDREIYQAQSAFGVELYDKLMLQQQSGKGNVLPVHLDDFMPSDANQKAVHAPLEACRADVTAKQKEIDAKRIEIEKLQCNRERFRGSALEKFKHDAASRSEEAKLHVQIKLLEREIQQRKEEFGRTVFDLLVESNDSERSNSSKARGGGGGGFLDKLKPENKTQKEMAAVIERAKRPVALARQKKVTAEREIAELDGAAAP